MAFTLLALLGSAGEHYAEHQKVKSAKRQAEREANPPPPKVQRKSKKDRKAAYDSIMANEPPFIQGSYGEFPAKFTMHLGKLGDEDISATYWLHDENEKPFLAMTGYYDIYGRLFTLHSGLDINSPTLGVVDSPKGSKLAYTHNMTLPAPPGESDPWTCKVPFNGAFRFEIDGVGYTWEADKERGNRAWRLVRKGGGEILCRCQTEKQSIKVTVEKGVTLRGTIEFEGKGLVAEELGPYARLAIVLTGLDRCHEAINLRLGVAR